MPDSPRPPLYLPQPFSTSSLRRLGEALAAERHLTDAEADLWGVFSSDAFARSSTATDAVSLALEADSVRTVLPRVAAAEVTGRAKTRRTLVEKLQRTPQIKLPSIHDVAGVRVVGNFSLFEQNQAAAVISYLFDEAIATSRPVDRVDRRSDDSFGYRAIHLVAWPEGRPVEIQIRTELQHAWAELMEVLADRWGREPRYGLPVVEADDQERNRRQTVIDALIDIAGNIADFENASVGSGLAYVHLPTSIIDADDVEIDLTALEELQRNALQLEPEIDAQRATLLRALNQFAIDADLT